jgi:hypothetical protein
LGPNERWSAVRKREVVLRLLGGESVDALSRAPGVEIYRLEPRRDKALPGSDASLRERGGDPLRPSSLNPGARHLVTLLSSRD